MACQVAKISSYGIRSVMLTLLMLLLYSKTANPLEIVTGNLPVSVQNGSSSGVILDCPYDLGIDDTRGLVIKWYFSNSPTPVYQWIPGNQPQDLGKLSGKLDLSFEASEDQYKKHRALAIQEPTPNLNGKYSCWVSNFMHEVKMDSILIVYVPTNELFMTAETYGENSVKIFCSAEGLFPKPKLELHKRIESSKKFESVEALSYAEYSNANETFSVGLEKEFKHRDLDEVNKFLCSLTIPDTGYHLDKMVTYYPGGKENCCKNYEGNLFLLTAAFLISTFLISH